MNFQEFKELGKQAEVDLFHRTLQTLTDVLILCLIIWLILN